MISFLVNQTPLQASLLSVLIELMKNYSGVKIENLNRKINADFSLQNISFDIPTGSILTIIGKSGSGKSQLLRCIAGLEKYTVTEEYKPAVIGLVFQSSNLFTHLNLQDNILLALKKVQKKSHAESEKICSDVLTQVQLSHRRKNYPHQMSGGEQQRGAIARALALKPQLLLYDEPTSALDPELEEEVFKLILELQKTGITQIVVTHEVSAARRLGDYIAYMNYGELRLFCPHQEVSQHLHKLDEIEKNYVELFA